MTTAGGLVFMGTPEGYFKAFYPMLSVILIVARYYSAVDGAKISY